MPSLEPIIYICCMHFSELATKAILSLSGHDGMYDRSLTVGYDVVIEVTFLVRGQTSLTVIMKLSHWAKDGLA